MSDAGDAIRAKVADLECQAKELRSEAARLDRQAEEAIRKANELIPVDRNARQLTDGSPVPDDASHAEKTASGQQKAYVVLSPAELKKGFVRPLRDAYRHLSCGSITTMRREIAQTYARDPSFYGGTFCSQCRGHFPVGEDGEFTWYEMDGSEGPKVGT